MDLIKGLLRRPILCYLILLAMGLAGSMDFDDARRHQSVYCKMVAEGLWPDYDRVYKKECTALGYPSMHAAFNPEGKAAR